MRFPAVSALVAALATSATALDLSSALDQDSSVWAALDGVGGGGSEAPISNRPAKRQSGWNPPADLARPLKQVWDHCLATYSQGLYGFKNYGWDQIMATNG